MAVNTTASIVVRSRTAAIMRNPGRPYGIHVRACSHATKAAAKNPGQMRGTGALTGHSPMAAVAAHSAAMVMAP